MINIFICEDDTMQRKKIEIIIENYILIQEIDMQVTLSTANPYDILDYLEDYPQTKGIYFLDIDLGSSINGIELGAQIRNININGKIIFITTHTELAPLTFKYKVEAMDYIIKDNDDIETRIIEIIERVQSHYFSENKQDRPVIKINIGSQERRYLLSDIMFFETSPTPHKIELHLKNSLVEFYEKMNEIEKWNDKFIRAHHSFVVNKENISSIDKKKRELTMTNGEICLISSRYIKYFK